MVVDIVSGGPSDWSPDGSQLLYTSNPSGNSDEVYVIGANGSGQECTTCDDTRNGGPSWSPEGGRFVLNSRQDGTLSDPNAAEVYVRSLDGSEVTRLTTNSVADGGSHWQPFRHLGRAFPGETVTRIMTIRNRGADILDVDGISVNGDHFSVSHAALEGINQGEQREVVVTFDPGENTRPLEAYATLTISSNDNSRSTIPLKVNAAYCGADFNADRTVDFDDFFLFADAFGKSDEDEGWTMSPPRVPYKYYDLEADGTINLDDFFKFGDAFGLDKELQIAKPIARSAVQQAEPYVRMRKEGKDVRVTIGLDGAESARGYAVLLEYDPSILRFVRSETEVNWFLLSRSMTGS